MSNLYENGVVGKIRLPDGARILKELHIAGYGLVALLLDVMGNEITYLHLRPLGIQRTAWNSEPFGTDMFHDNFDADVENNINDNGGIFISKHPLGMDGSGNLVFKSGSQPIMNTSSNSAQNYAQENIIPGLYGKLLSGGVYDTIGQLLIKTGLMSEDDYLNVSDANCQHIMHEDHGGFNLYDFFGDLYESIWTSEMFADTHIVVRMGSPHTDGEAYYNARMRYTSSPSVIWSEIKTRVMFCI